MQRQYLVIKKRQIDTFQQKILSWYKIHKRELPWRSTHDAYKILISEVMSQQTQIARVVPKYEAWIKRFPDVQSLANATNTEVLRYWSGLGYNRRALNLKKTAGVITAEYQGSFPKDIEQLKKLPGIGEYTARAVACFAFNQQIAVVDTNVRRVILTQVQITNSKFQISNKELQQIADQLLPKGKAYEWNQALMDYAAAMLKEHRIPIPKQSKFVGSNRFYRGKLIKYLIEHHALPLAVAEQTIGYDKTTANAPLSKIIDDLLSEGIVQKTNDQLQLKE